MLLRICSRIDSFGYFDPYCKCGIAHSVIMWMGLYTWISFHLLLDQILKENYFMNYRLGKNFFNDYSLTDNQ